MKKITLLIITLFVIGLVIGCKKEIDTKSNTEGPLKTAINSELENLYKQLVIPDFGKITAINKGEILKFESAEHYEQVYESLNALYEAWTTLFIQTYDTGDEDELDATIERLNFDENLPLYKFEQKYKVIQAATLLEENTLRESTWLEQGANGRSPSDPITQCPIEQTLLSNYYEYCIGDTICQLRPGEYQILIHTSNLQYLNQIRNSTIQELLGRGEVPPGTPLPTFPKKVVVTDPPVTILDPNEIDCNVSNYSNSDFIEHGSDYKFYWTYNYGYNWNGKKVKTNATMTNYKKNKKHNWVKDYGSFCKIEINTSLNDYYYETEDCQESYGMVATGLNTKVVWKSLTARTFAEIFEVVSFLPEYEERAVGCKRHNTDNCVLWIRHKSVVYKINVKTKSYVII